MRPLSILNSQLGLATLLTSIKKRMRRETQKNNNVGCQMLEASANVQERFNVSVKCKHMLVGPFLYPKDLQ